MSPFFLTTIIWIKPPVEEEEEEEEEYRSDGVWDGDYGWGVRVSRPFGARWRSSAATVSGTGITSGGGSG
jgi:hypothetical protein